MPFDRRISVNITGPGMRNQYNEYVPGDVTALTVWASKYDSLVTRAFRVGSAA